MADIHCLSCKKQIKRQQQQRPTANAFVSTFWQSTFSSESQNKTYLISSKCVDLKITFNELWVGFLCNAICKLGKYHYYDWARTEKYFFEITSRSTVKMFQNMLFSLWKYFIHLFFKLPRRFQEQTRFLSAIAIKNKFDFNV